MLGVAQLDGGQDLSLRGAGLVLRHEPLEELVVVRGDRGVAGRVLSLRGPPTAGRFYFIACLVMHLNSFQPVPRARPLGVEDQGLAPREMF